MKYAYLTFVLTIVLSCAEKKKINSAISLSYLNNIKTELQKAYPNNRTINLVFHGHSVPAGYATTPRVNTFGSYPFLLLKELKELYPDAVINIIVTARGGENSLSGEKRFDSTVLNYKPDVLFIDYALNDRSIGLDSSKHAWESMIQKALDKNIKIILMTPSPDELDSNHVLAKYSEQIRTLANKFHTGLGDSYQAFSHSNQQHYMAQANHPNEKGNLIIADELMKYFR